MFGPRGFELGRDGLEMDRTIRLILTVFLLLLLIGMMPVWPYATGWGYGWYPSGGLGLILLVVLVIALMGGERGGPRARL